MVRIAYCQLITSALNIRAHWVDYSDDVERRL